jgi:hypothetical protein
MIFDPHAGAFQLHRPDPAVQDGGMPGEGGLLAAARPVPGCLLGSRRAVWLIVAAVVIAVAVWRGIFTAAGSVAQNPPKAE